MGYVETPWGLSIIFAWHISNGYKICLYKNWCRYKKKTFTNTARNGRMTMERSSWRRTATAWRSNARSFTLLPTPRMFLLPLHHKIANLLEIQVVGSTVAMNLDWSKGEVWTNCLGKVNDQCHWGDQGQRLKRVHQSLAHQDTSLQDSLRAE